MATAPKTVFTYPLNGTERDFRIDFEYLARRFVQVTLIGQDRKQLDIGTDYRFSTNRTITTTLAWGPSMDYESIEIRRFTSATERLVDFNDGSILKAYDLNTSQVQALHIAEEGRDIATDTIGVDNNGNLDARGRRIVNGADGIDPGDFVTMRQQLNESQSAITAAVRARNSETAAAASASTANGAANTASQKAASAAVDAEAARLEAAAAVAANVEIESNRRRAETAATNATASEGRAKTSETKAGVSASDAKASAESALNAALISNTAGLQLGMSTWGNRSRPFMGFALDDGQELERSLFPDFVAALDSGAFPVVTQAQWDANPNLRACFVAVSSPGMFRMRDLNGATSGSIVPGGAFIRGGTATTAGLERDQVQNITGSVELAGQIGGTGGPSPVTGAFSVVQASTSNGRTGGAATASHTYTFSASGSARTGTETFPSHATGAWMTRLYGLITPLGAAEASSLATAYASLKADIDNKLAPLWADRNKTKRLQKATLWTGLAGNGATVTLSDDVFNYHSVYGYYATSPSTLLDTWVGLRELALEPIGTQMYVVRASAWVLCRFMDTDPNQRRVLNFVQFAPASNGVQNLYGTRYID